MNKKFLSFFFVSVFVIALCSAFASASFADNVQSGITSVTEALNPITTLLFGSGSSASADNAFVSWMAFILTLLVVGGILSPFELFGDKSFVNWGIATVIALIGVRFIPVDALRAFTLGSEGLVGSLFLIIPFVIVAGLIIKSSSAAVRKILWVVYTVVMISLLAWNWSNAGSWSNFYWVYVGIVAVCILLFLMDGTIQKFFTASKVDRMSNNIDSNEKARVVAKISDLEGAITALAGTDPKEEKRLKEKVVALKKLLY